MDGVAGEPVANPMTNLFANPALLPLAAAVPLLAAFFVWGWWRRRRALAALGLPSAVRRLVAVKPWVRRLRWSWVLSGLSLLALAAAGPQWGRLFGASLTVRT